MQTWVFDLDGTITAFPDEMNALMSSLKAAGHRVEVLSGFKGDSADQSVLDEKQALLKSLGCDCYDRLVVVANPKNDVAAQKAAYMRQVNATALVDNNHKNVRTVRKAGFLVMRPGRK